MFRDLKRFGRDPTVVRRTNTWDAPFRWDDAARARGSPGLVFTCSLSDFFHEGADLWRDEAWGVIRACQHLQFQVLTKRPVRIPGHLPADWGEGYPNVWLGTSIGINENAWRADVLRQIPARVRFISAEPVLEPLPDLDLTGIHWLIVGGESGPGFRYMDHAWARQLRDKARAAGVAFFFKRRRDGSPAGATFSTAARGRSSPPRSQTLTDRFSECDRIEGA
jgi:protein gp37